MPDTIAPNEPEVSTETTLSFQTAPAERKPILLVGDDLGWLEAQKQIAGRTIVVADPQATAETIFNGQSFDAIVASYADASKSVQMLRTALEKDASTTTLLRADGKDLNGVTNPFPVVQRVESAEILDDRLRTRIAASRWQSTPGFLALTAQITKLPTLPSIYTQINTALQSPDTSIEEVAELVTREPAVSAKLLQMVNSPLLGLRGRVTSVRDATSLLGLSRLRSLVLATSLFKQFDASKCRSFSISRFESQSLQVASWAATIAKEQSRDKAMADMAFTASLLHNFGMLLMAANFPEEYDTVLKQAGEQRVSVAWAELQTYGATHAEIAGAVLASWGIPYPIVNAVGWYPQPSASEDDGFSALTAVHAATAVETYDKTGMFAYDRSYLERLQLAEKVEQWCATLPQAQLAA